MSNEKSVEMSDPLFIEPENRFVLFPIHPIMGQVFELYKTSPCSFWTVEEVDLSKDMNDWEKLSEGEQHFVKNVLAFFAK